MGVTKYRSIEEVPRPPLRTGAELEASIRAVLKRAFSLCPPLGVRGVTRFRSIDEASAAREQATIERMRRLRAAR
jgi:hypothetical protein